MGLYTGHPMCPHDIADTSHGAGNPTESEEEATAPYMIQFLKLHHFHFILFIKNESLNPTHMQGEYASPFIGNVKKLVDVFKPLQLLISVIL